MSNDNIEKNEEVMPEPKVAVKPEPSVSRRRFLTGAAGLAAGTLLGPALSPKAFGPFVARAQTPGKQKLKIMYVGTGGQAGSHMHLADSETCIAYADVDTSRMGTIKGKAPNAAGYTDWRSMFDAHLDKADAVIVTTPDHSHALPSLRAILAGKAVYTEKPLTWSIEESRLMQEATQKMKVSTQMGNMGHANEGNRIVVEWVRGGMIGEITEVHTWTNRPVWPQGDLKIEEIPKPDNLNWDVWVGPAEMRPYQKNLHAFNWRGWFDFGCGAVGDMGCHTWDCVFWALNPDYPSSVELLEVKEPGQHTFARQTHFRWNFPAKGARRPFEAHWYSGGMRPPVPDEIKNDPARPADKRDLPESGTLFIGTKGKMLVTGDYSERARLIPESFMQEAKRPEKTIPRSPGHKEEWVMAAKGEKPWDFPGSNFATYAAPLTEVMLLGSIVEKIGEVGYKFECDPVKREIITPRVKQMRTREYRKGFELPKIT